MKIVGEKYLLFGVLNLDGSGNFIFSIFLRLGIMRIFLKGGVKLIVRGLFKFLGFVVFG